MRFSLAFSLLMFFACTSLPKGKGDSKSNGSVSNGSLSNGRRFPKKGDNYKYFSTASYLLFNRAWVNNQVLEATLASYQSFPDQKFLLMECSKRHGGRIWPHRTHQNGTSIDFAVPLLKNDKPFYTHHHYALLHYAMKFDEHGVSKYNRHIKIDFETMAQHILTLDNAARKRGMYVKKVILKINLKDDFYASKSGKKVKAREIYFAKSLPAIIDNVHDDHYHVDFGFL